MLSPEESNRQNMRLVEFLQNHRDLILQSWIDTVQETDPDDQTREALRQTVEEHLHEIHKILQDPSYQPPTEFRGHDFRQEANVILRGEEVIAQIFQQHHAREKSASLLQARLYINRVFCHYLQIRCGLCSVPPVTSENPPG
ncbi:MAG: RsbRD N-terminal domain-containing protein [Opitutales bacterium]|nr:RsbRD N-terminal domain-containing protein [Opitutales bacterium]